MKNWILWEFFVSFPGGNAKLQKHRGSVNFVHEGFVYTKNIAVSLKKRLRCHRWPDGCKSTTFIQDNHFHLNIKCQHEPEMSEVKKRIVESEIKNLAGTTCTSLKQMYDSHVTIESNIQPFVRLHWAMGKRREKIFHPHKPLLTGSKFHWKRELELLHRALGKWPKSLTNFFDCFSMVWHANGWKRCQSFTLMVPLRLRRNSFTSW